MMIEVVDEKLKKFFNEIRTRLDKRSDKQLSNDSIKREQFVRILQKRYGYSKEKAESEMSAHYSEIILG